MQRKCASTSRHAPDGEMAFHGFRNAPGQRQAQARAMNLRGRHKRTAIERLENMRQIRGADADTTVRDADLDFLAAQSMFGESRLNADPAPFTAVLQGV